MLDTMLRSTHCLNTTRAFLKMQLRIYALLLAQCELPIIQSALMGYTTVHAKIINTLAKAAGSIYKECRNAPEKMIVYKQRPA